MDLNDYYAEHGREGLNRLAEKVDTSPKYLYQIATNRRGLSARLAKELCVAEPGLSFEDLLFQRERCANV